MLFADLIALFPPFVLSFSQPQVPTFTPPPTNPLEDEEKARQREAKAAGAAVDLAAGGRRSTVYAGGEMAREEQMQRGRKRLGVASEELI